MGAIFTKDGEIYKVVGQTTDAAALEFLAKQKGEGAAPSAAPKPATKPSKPQPAKKKRARKRSSKKT